jgi:hypothetical protein
MLTGQDFFTTPKISKRQQIALASTRRVFLQHLKTSECIPVELNIVSTFHVENFQICALEWISSNFVAVALILDSSESVHVIQVFQVSESILLTPVAWTRLNGVPLILHGMNKGILCSCADSTLRWIAFDPLNRVLTETSRFELVGAVLCLDSVDDSLVFAGTDEGLLMVFELSPAQESTLELLASDSSRINGPVTALRWNSALEILAVGSVLGAVYLYSFDREHSSLGFKSQLVPETSDTILSLDWIRESLLMIGTYLYWIKLFEVLEPSLVFAQRLDYPIVKCLGLTDKETLLVCTSRELIQVDPRATEEKGDASPA